MVRPLYAALGALALLLGWLGLVAYQAQWQSAAAVRSLADSAERCHLVGIAARGYLLVADLRRRELRTCDERSADNTRRRLIAEIVQLRTAAARVLLDAGYGEAAEAVALAAARADYADVPARALLLETRLGSPRGNAAQRELMLLLLQDESPPVLYVLGKALSRGGYREDAAGYLHRALRLDPSHFPTYIALAELALAQQDRAGALDWLDQAAPATRSGSDRQTLVRLRSEAEPRYQALPALAALWWREHWASALVGMGYLLFLLLPHWPLPTLRRFRKLPGD
jgi:tetratricopeptide (TPR) repeat protein